MNLYQKNKNFRNKNLNAILVENIEEDIDNNISIQNISAKNGMQTARLVFDNNESIFMHSSYDPKRDASKKIASLDYSNNSLIFVLGLGLGYHIEEILQKATPNSRIVIIEPFKEVYENFLQTKNMKNIFNDKRVTLFINVTLDKFISVFNYLLSKKYFDITHTIQFIALDYYAVKKDILQFIKGIKNLIVFSWRSKGNCHIDHNIGVIQTILNIDDVIENIGIVELTNKFEGQSAIIVSAGPSLNKNIKYLKEAKGKALIITVDAVMERLLNEDIVPDIVVSMERINVYEKILKKIKKDIPKEIVLAVPALTQVQNLKFFKDNKKIFWLQNNVGTQQYFEDILKKGLLNNSSSAAYASLALAKELGCKNIAFVGQDLAYSKKGDIYCGGISNLLADTEEEMRKDNNYIVKVKDYAGNDINSNVFWKDQLISISNYITIHPEINVYDATEGGAKIEGTAIIRLKDFLDRYCFQSFAVYSILENIQDKKTKIEKKEVLKKLVKKMEESNNKYLIISKELNNKYKRISKLYQKYVLEADVIPELDRNSILNEIKNTDKIITKLTLDEFLSIYYQGLIASFKKEMNEIKAEKLDERILKKIRVQHKYLEILNNVYKINWQIFDYLLNYLNKRIKGESIRESVFEILKFVLNKNKIDTAFLEKYFIIHSYKNEEIEVFLKEG